MDVNTIFVCVIMVVCTVAIALVAARPAFRVRSAAVIFVISELRRYGDFP